MRAGKSNSRTSHVGSWATFAPYSFHSLSRQHLDQCPRSSLVAFQINLLHGEHERLCCYVFIDGELTYTSRNPTEILRGGL